MESMTEHPISPQELRDLLLPTLACLPTAFLSPKPPPALLPLLSPILRQRVYLDPSESKLHPPNGWGNGWLHLLTWSREGATRLAEVVSTLQLEPHPVSGELELFGDTNDPDAERVWYRSLDDETVQARINVKEHNLAFTWVWCSNDTGGVGIENLVSLGDSVDEKGSNGWRIAEVIALEFDENMELEGWQDTLRAITTRPTTRRNTITNRSSDHGASSTMFSDDEADADDDYWASYDKTPGKGSVAPSPAPAIRTTLEQNGERSDQGYFERYANEVQPAMDAHDPDEEATGQPFKNTLQSDQAPADTTQRHRIEQTRPAYTLPGHAGNYSGSNGVARSSASPQTPNRDSSAAEATVRHHISGEIKHLFKLSRGVGMERDEFESLVKRELEMLRFLDGGFSKT